MPCTSTPDSYTLRYFGDHWDVPMLDGAEQVDLPTGHCVLCKEDFEEGDQGHYYASGQPVHRECSLRAVLGGINHLKGTCTCKGGTDLPDPPGLSSREAARLVLDWAQQVERTGEYP